MKKNIHLLIFVFYMLHAIVALMTCDHKIHKLDTATCTWVFCNHFECIRSVIFRKMPQCTKPTMLNDQSHPASDTKSMQRANQILVNSFFFQPNKSLTKYVIVKTLDESSTDKIWRHYFWQKSLIYLLCSHTENWKSSSQPVTWSLVPLIAPNCSVSSNSLLLFTREDDKIEIHSISNRGYFWSTMIRSCVLDTPQKLLKARVSKMFKLSRVQFQGILLPTLSSFHAFTPLAIWPMKSLVLTLQPIKATGTELNIDLNMV